MRVTGVDACGRGWVAVSLEAAGPLVAAWTDASLDALLAPP